MHNLRPGPAALIVGWWFGFGYFLAGLYWIGEAFLVEAETFAWALPFAVTLLPAGLALFFAFGCGAARLFWPPGFRRLLVLAVALAVAEWLRGHVLTGLPWNILGYALTYPLPLMQGASLLGVYGLTPWTVLIAAAPLVMAAEPPAGRPWRGVLASALLAALPLAALLTYGLWRLADGPPGIVGPRLRIVQPAVPQRDKWRPEKQRDIFTAHLDLSRHDPTGVRDDLAGITHVFWPEAAMPFMPLSNPEALAAIGDLLPEGTQLITGALRIEDQAGGAGARPRAFNSLMVFGDTGGLTSLYDKIHLVPFGEYLPFQETLEALGLEQLTRLRGGFSAGPSPRRVMEIDGLPPALALICYEAIFPGAVVQGGRRPNLLINVTNDGWFGDTTGPHQHFHQARVRAVEEGIPLVRIANNGVSAVIDRRGRVLGRLGIDQRGVIDAPVPEAGPASAYAAYGDCGLLVSVLAFILGSLVPARRVVLLS